MSRQPEWIPEEHDPILIAAFNRNASSRAIGASMGFSHNTICERINALNLRPPPEPEKASVPPQANGRLPASKPCPISFARQRLGSRFSERTLPDGSTSYFLDGGPTSLDAFMLEANRVAAAKGDAMLTVNRRWVPR
jgi:hypothetical protein